MKSIRSIMITVILYCLMVVCLAGLGTQIYVNNYGNISDGDFNKLSTLSADVAYINSNLSSFNNETLVFQQLDTSNIKEYIAEFLDSRNTVQQFIGFLQQIYRSPNLMLMALPFESAELLELFSLLMRIFFIGTITLAIYVALRSGGAVSG